MRLNPVTLSFSNDQANLEKEFRTSYFHNNLDVFRLSHLFSIFFYGLAAVIDYMIFYDQFLILASIKFLIVIPVFILGFFFTFTPKYKQLWPWINNFYVILTGSGFIAMIVVAKAPLGYSYYAGIIICLVFGYAFIRSRFIMASTAGLILSTLFLITSIVIKTPGNLLILHIFFLFTVNAVGMIICYSAEIYSRRDFFLRHLLEQKSEQVERSNIVLEELISIRTQRLTESNQSLKEEIKGRKALETRLVQAQKMEAIGQLAGGIAHDFNNILSPIIGYTELLMSKTDEDDTNTKYLNKIFSGAMRAGTLVKQILTFSHQADSLIKLMEIKPVVEEAMALIRSSIPGAIEIFENFDNDCGIIKADPTQIHQIVMNIATNAYQAMEISGGTLTVDLYNEEFTGNDSDELPPEGSYACLVITDSGEGMTEAVQKRVFEPFFTTRETGKGTGMGLSVVHGIVKKCNGIIKLFSEPDKGTSIQVYLPIASEPIKKNNPNEKRPFPKGNGTILVVDDEAPLVEMLETWLKKWGYNVIAHSRSYDALEAFLAQPDAIDFVISDLNMPEMTGKKLSSEILKIRKDMPIILCTGFNELLSKKEAEAIGIKDYLNKPVSMRMLADKINELLNPDD